MKLPTPIARAWRRRRRRLGRALEPPLVVSLAVVAIVLVPAWLPVLLFVEDRRQRRMREAAEHSRCEVCGQPLGRRSLELADAELAQEWDGRRRRCEYRAPRLVHAICATCGARYIYREQEAWFARYVEEAPHAQA